MKEQEKRRGNMRKAVIFSFASEDESWEVL